MATLTQAPATHPLYERHKAIIDRAVQAVHERVFYAQYPEMPSPQVYGEGADAAGKADYEAQVGQAFTRLKQASDSQLTSSEASPYTQQPLGISYPAFNNEADYIAAAQTAFDKWKASSAHERAGILVEALERVKNHFFEIAYSTMHTTGQAFMMSFQASGPHANDRALEAIALGYQEQTRFPAQVKWDKPAGKVNIVLQKHFVAVPKGVSLAIGCSTFPIWNSVPGIFASLITGNTCVVKPHPHAIYPIAIVVAELQAVLAENGYAPEVCTLAVDNDSKLITKTLAEDARVKIIDFTGSSTFGEYVERLPNKTTFTEKAGVNSVIIDSATDLGAMAQNIAFSITLYSGQMCTAPQNIFIPRTGIQVAGQQVPYDQVAAAITEAVKGLAGHPKAGPAVLGAIQSKATQQRVQDAHKGKVLLASGSISNPEFPNARIATPVVIEVDAHDVAYWQREMFGPIAYIIPTDSTAHSLHLAKDSAEKHGAISCGAYTTNAAVMEDIATQMAEAYTPVSFNLTGGIYVNQHAGFSDFHVTGGNPAGNASFTNPEFVLKRFTMVGMRVNG